jgi:hypothetical protein
VPVVVATLAMYEVASIESTNCHNLSEGLLHAAVTVGLVVEAVSDIVTVVAAEGMSVTVTVDIGTAAVVVGGGGLPVKAFVGIVTLNLFY